MSPDPQINAVYACLKGLIVESPLGMFAVDATQTIQCCSRRICSLFGFREEELVGSPVGKLLSGRERGIFKATLEKVLAQQDLAASGAELGVRQMTGLRKDGSTLPVEIGLTRMLLPDDRMMAVAVVTDLSARVEVEDRLRRSEDRFRRLASLSSDYFWELDHELRFTFVSSRDGSGKGSRLRELFMSKRFDEIEGIRPVSFSWDEHLLLKERHQAFRNRVHATDAPGETTRYFSVSGEPVFDQSGRFTGYQGVASDVTQLETARVKELEREQAQVKALSDELERYRSGMGGFSALPVGSAMYGTRTVSEAAPDDFEELSREYHDILLKSLEARILKLEVDAPDRLREIAEQLGSWLAGPRDVVELHQRSIARVNESMPPLKARALVEEGRYLVLELMGRLAMFYRRYYSGRSMANAGSARKGAGANVVSLKEVDRPGDGK